MQLIPNGPDIPSALLQAHEEGRVVFFCGAGIACSAGLPLFKGLVDKIYQKLHTSYSEQGHELEKTAYCASSFDRVLQLLEQRYPGGKNEARKVLPEILATPNPTELALANHKALLTLAADSTNKVKLVTTNYDHLFAQAAEKLDKTHNYYSAPLLPLPKQNIWNGVVYLHGLLPFSYSDSTTQNHASLSLSNLVLTSGDFGAAYLTERWAARFVTELFKKYVVCFIGYSLDDPILRYMVDALAADAEQGELEYQAYAFASYGETNQQSVASSWRAKGVQPILYSSMNKHELLRDTLTQWASNYELGADTHKQVVSSYANTIPSKSTKEDDYVSRVLWAVSDASGEGAKAFAEYQPVPPFEWFDVFTEKRYEHADLLRFQVSDYPKTLTNDQPLKFSLLHRPTPSKQTSWLSPLTGNAELQLDTVTYQLCRWMVRHLDQSKLLLVVAKHGGKVHETFKQLIQDELDAIHQSADSGQTIAEPLQRLWKLLLVGYMETNTLKKSSVYQWRHNVKMSGLSFAAKKEFAQLIQPKLLISPKLSFESKEAKLKTKVTDWVSVEIFIAESHLRYEIYDKDQVASDLKKYLPTLLPIVQQALLELLDLMQEVDSADAVYDKSHFHLPSISAHWQNRHHHSWTVLIELLRDALLELAQQAPDKAQSIAVSWFEIPFLSFKRLALFAASQDGLVPSKTWLSWLIQNSQHCLWHVTMQREVCRLLATQARYLAKHDLASLETVLLAGRPESMYSEQVKPETRQHLHDTSRWLRLIKLQEGGAVLSQTAQEALSEITQRCSYLKVEEHQKEEFSNWMVGSFDPGYSNYFTLPDAPKDLKSLITWIIDNSREGRRHLMSNWDELCEKHPCRTQLALMCCAKDGTWPIDRWMSALYIWAKNKYRARKSWKLLSKFLVSSVPDKKFDQLKYPLANWLKKCTEYLVTDDESFYQLVDKLIAANFKEGELDRADSNNEEININTAINHSLGLTAGALMSEIFKGEPKDGDGLTEPQKQRLECLLSEQQAPAGQAHLIIAEYAIGLFRLDQPWAEEFLIPRFDWHKEGASAFWMGFLLAPRPRWSFLQAIKKPFIEAAEHYEALGELAPQYAAFTTYLALNLHSVFSKEDLIKVFNQLPIAGLEAAANQIAIMQENTSNQGGYWGTNTLPFYESFWPKDKEKLNPAIARQWLDVVLNAGDKTPEAFDKLKAMIQACSKNERYQLHLVKQSKMCEKYPVVALAVLQILFTGDGDYKPSDLHACLNEIQRNKPEFESQIAAYKKKMGL